MAQTVFVSMARMIWFDDVIVGAPLAGSNPLLAPDSGAVFVYYGKASGFDSVVQLGDIDGTNGFRVLGLNVGDEIGEPSSVGDINGDGVEDLLIGAPDINGFTGGAYVVFGKTTGFAADFDLASLDGTNGFRVDGVNAGDVAGISISAGDINGDGYDELVLGANGANPNGPFPDGAVYVVYGKASGFGASLNLGNLDGFNGFRIDGSTEPFNRLGDAVDAGSDFNGDGFNDIVMGIPGDPGATYIFYGGIFFDTPLFSQRGDVVDFNNVNAGSYADGSQYKSQGGDDIVTLPLNAAAAAAAGYDASFTFDAGDGADVITGGDLLDKIVGGAGNNTISGGLGADTLSGGFNRDTFVYAAGDGGATNAGADNITHFSDDFDLIGLTNGLTFAQLTIDQNTDVIGDATLDAVISITAGGEVLTILDGGGSLTLDSNDFMLV